MYRYLNPVHPQRANQLTAKVQQIRKVFQRFLLRILQSRVSYNNFKEISNNYINCNILLNTQYNDKKSLVKKQVFCDKQSGLLL